MAIFKKLIMPIIIGFACAAGIAFWWSSPILYTLPQPLGPYGIGTFLEYATYDNHTVELQFWYPTDNIKSCSYPYGTASRNTHIINLIIHKIPYLPRSLLCNALNVCSYAEPHGTLSTTQQRYPLVIFLPGYGGSCFLYSALLEDVASSGFIICGINSPLINTLQLPDGHIMEPDPRVYSDKDGIEKGINAVMLHTKRIVDSMTTNNNDKNSFWYQRIDLTKLIIMGHSFGGSTAVEIARNDHRFTAGVNLDGWLKMQSTDKIEIPFLFLLNDSLFPVGRQDGTQEINETCQASTTCTAYSIPNAGHSSFYDLAFLKWPFNQGELDRGKGDPYIIFENIKKAVKSHIQN
jgi:dienelactone hydrolase